MKKLLASTALALMVAGPVIGEAHMAMFVDTAAEGDIYGSNLIGMRLYVAETELDETAPVTAEARTEWNDVGEISDVLISTDGDVKAALLDIGGFLGIGEKTIAINLDSLKFMRDADNPDDVFVAMQASQEELDNAPEFERADMTEMDASAVDTMADSANTGASGEAMTMWERPVVEREGYQSVAARDLTAEDLEGAMVYGASDETIAEIEDLILTADGQVQDAIVDVGGFLGIGEHRITISFDELEVVRADDGSNLRVYVGATQEQLEARPAYEG